MTDAKDHGPEADGKLKRKEYERELARLHVEFVKLQQGVVHQGLKAVSSSKAVTVRVGGHDQGHDRAREPAYLPGNRASAPTEREKSQIYAQRYLPHLPAAGES